MKQILAKAKHYAGNAKHYAQSAAAVILLTPAALLLALTQAATGCAPKVESNNDNSWIF